MLSVVYLLIHSYCYISVCIPQVGAIQVGSLPCRHCMTVTSVLHRLAIGIATSLLRSAVDRSAVFKNYVTITSPIYRSAADRLAILYTESVKLYTTHLSTADLSILYSVFVNPQSA